MSFRVGHEDEGEKRKMTIHRSLRSAGSLVRHRNVLSREERIKRLEDEGRWIEGKNAVFCLPKVKNIKALKKKGAAKKKAEEGEAAEGAVAGAPAPEAAAPSAEAATKATKAAKPAKGGKG